MKVWARRRLGDLVDVLSGFAFESEGFSDSGDLPIVRIRDVVRGHSSTFYRGAFDTKYIVRTGDLLIGMDGEFNRARWSGGDALLNQRVCRIASRSAELHDNYLFHFLPRVLKAIERATPFVTVKHLSVKQIVDISIQLPPISDQQRIAAILDKADALRAKRRAALAQLETLTQAIYLETVGDPVTNPRSWPLVPFQEICERVTVGIVVQPASYYVPEGIPALRSLNIKRGDIVLSELVYFSKADNDTKLRKTKLKAGDLVLVRSGQPGAAAVVPDFLDGVNAVDLLIATPNREIADAQFLCTFFNSAGGRDLVLSKQRGQVQKHLNVGSLNQALIPLPPLCVQQQFAASLNAARNHRTKQKRSLQELDALFTSLQHRAFRGEM